MKMISYWKGIDGQPEPLEIYEDKEGLVFIIGTYNHKNQNKAEKALGIHWGDYPQSRGILAPCVIPLKHVPQSLQVYCIKLLINKI